MTSKQIARVAAIRKSVATRPAPTEPRMPARSRARVSVSAPKGLLADCVAAAGFAEHRAA